MKNTFGICYLVTSVIFAIGTIIVVKKNDEAQEYYRKKFDEALKSNPYIRKEAE